MRTPEGGHRSTQWVIQTRTPAVAENAVVVWKRYPAGVEFTVTAAGTKTLLKNLREIQPEVEWRAIRVESVQRIEDW